MAGAPSPYRRGIKHNWIFDPPHYLFSKPRKNKVELSTDASAHIGAQIETLTRQTEAGKEIPLPESGLIAVPDGVTIHDIQEHLPAPRRFSGVFKTPELQAFIDYVEVQGEECQITVDKNNLTAQAIFDLGTPDQPGWQKHQARLFMQRTEPLKALLAVNEEWLKQGAIEEFIEDYADHIHFGDADDDDGGLTIAQAIQAIRSIKADVTGQYTSEESDHRAARSSMERIEVQARGDLALPRRLSFTCEPYPDLEDRQYDARITTRWVDGKPLFKIRVAALAAIQTEIALEVLDRINNAVTANGGIYVGTWT